jgi:hypothetical protein
MEKKKKMEYLERHQTIKISSASNGTMKLPMPKGEVILDKLVIWDDADLTTAGEQYKINISEKERSSIASGAAAGIIFYANIQFTVSTNGGGMRCSYYVFDLCGRKTTAPSRYLWVIIRNDTGGAAVFHCSLYFRKR